MEVGLQLLLGLALALIVNQAFVGRALGRTLVFSPWAVSGVLTSAIRVLLSNSRAGTTRYLADMGMGSYGTSWLSDTSTVLQLPPSMILISGFIRNVPYSLEEAAWVDGCNRFAAFRIVVLPTLRPGPSAVGSFVSFLSVGMGRLVGLPAPALPTVHQVSIG